MTQSLFAHCATDTCEWDDDVTQPIPASVLAFIREHTPRRIHVSAAGVDVTITVDGSDQRPKQDIIDAVTAALLTGGKY